MTSVKEETLPHYAVELPRRVCGPHLRQPQLRGQPRIAPAASQHSEQVEDLKSAISYLASAPDVDAERIGLACVCLGPVRPRGGGNGPEGEGRRPGRGRLQPHRTYLGFLGRWVCRVHGHAQRSRQSVYESGEEQFMSAVAGPPTCTVGMPVREAFEYYSRAQDTERCVAEPPHVASMEQIIRLERDRARPSGDPTADRGPRHHDVLLPPSTPAVHDEASSTTKELVWITTTTMSSSMTRPLRSPSARRCRALPLRTSDRSVGRSRRTDCHIGGTGPATGGGGDWANRGIGYEVARQLMERGFEVVLGSRDLARVSTPRKLLVEQRAGFTPCNSMWATRPACPRWGLGSRPVRTY